MMISNILAAQEGMNDTIFSGASPLLLLVYAFFVALIIIAVTIFLRFLGSGMREIRLMRLEIGKLAEELRLLRLQLKERKQKASKTQ